MKKTLLPYVLLSIIVTLGTLYYQRITGPTYEKEVDIEMNGITYDFDLPRSHAISEPCLIKLNIPDRGIEADIIFRRYPTNENFISRTFERKEDTLVVELPNQPEAGKLEYNIIARTGNTNIPFMQDNNIVIRFKGHVPSLILFIHVFLMFFAYFFAILAGMLAICNQRKFKKYSWITLILIILGGLIFGPIVQKYAFGVYWSGIPYGTDLTDNKLLITFIAWLIAVLVNRKQDRRWWIVAALAINLVVYTIPHSAMGSEFDYETGEVGTTDKFRD
ncbi:hypothetical protein ACFLU5_02235 [Bacteroidota bacterium]